MDKQKSRQQLIILMPVYEDRESAARLIAELAKILSYQKPYILVVEDGSTQRPLGIAAIENAGLQGRILYLARNMGHQRAIATGLTYIREMFEVDTVIVMDSDGEDRPEMVPDLLKRLRTGGFDAIVAQRRRRSESFGFRLFYTAYKFLFKILTGRAIKFGNFAALSNRAVRRLASMQEIWVHFPASLMVSRLKIGFSSIDRGERYAGKSQMNFVSFSLHGLRSMMVFAEDILVRVGIFCATLAALAVFLFAALIVIKFKGLAIPGWFSIGSGVLVIIVLQAGVLVFVTLMISGVVRSSAPITYTQLNLLIDRIESTSEITKIHVV